MTRVMIVDDSPTIRQLLANLLAEDPDIEVVAQAASGEEALRLCERSVADIVTMDLVMPGMGGLGATKRIMECCPRPIVVVTEHTDSKDLNVAFEAMAAGAVDVVAKSSLFGESASDTAKAEFLAKLKSLAAAHPHTLRPQAGQDAT